ncbi:MAG: oxidoreductase [Planctomycetota bacterium]
MSAQVNWGILSTGNIAKTFAQGVQKSVTGKLVAVGSRSQESANKFADQFGIPNRHASYEALLADPEVHAVYIATPHPMHPEWAIKAARAGKHILCEKPVALNYWQAVGIVEACAEHDVFLMEAFMYRCSPQTKKLVELLREKVIGEVRLIQATFAFHAGFNPKGRLFADELGGGGILDVGCYPTSMARLVAGVAQGQDFADPVAFQGMGHKGQSGIDEWAVAIARFPGDIVAQLATGVSVNLENVVRIFGSEGNIFLPNPWMPGRDGSATKIVLTKKGAVQEFPIEYEKPLYAYEADTVAAYIKDRKAASPAMSPEDTLSNMKMLDQWRAGVGVEYGVEKSGAVPVLDGGPLKVRDGAPIPKGRIVGVPKDVSRLVMGVDNQVNASHAALMFDHFYERGGNCFDTGYIYGGGKLEKILGHWVKSRNLREKVVILDKGGHTPHCFPDAVNKQLLESLDRLEMDYIDIYMLHRDNPDVPVGEFVETLNAHIKAGRIRAYGLSNWSLERVKNAQAYAKSKGLAGIAAISNNFSLARMVTPVWHGCIAASTPEFRAWLAETQIPVMPWSSQARGFFVRGDRNFTADAELVRSWYSDDNFERLKRVQEFSAKRGVLPINVALAYVLCQPFPTFPLIGPRVPSETRTSLPGLNLKLTPDELKWLNLEA